MRSCTKTQFSFGNQNSARGDGYWTANSERELQNPVYESGRNSSREIMMRPRSNIHENSLKKKAERQAQIRTTYSGQKSSPTKLRSKQSGTRSASVDSSAGDQ